MKQTHMCTIGWNIIYISMTIFSVVCESPSQSPVYGKQSFETKMKQEKQNKEILLHNSNLIFANFSAKSKYASNSPNIPKIPDEKSLIQNNTPINKNNKPVIIKNNIPAIQNNKPVVQSETANIESEYLYYIFNSVLKPHNNSHYKIENNSVTPKIFHKKSDFISSDFVRFLTNESSTKKSLTDVQGNHTLVFLSSLKENISTGFEDADKIITNNSISPETIIDNNSVISTLSKPITEDAGIGDRISQPISDEFNLSNFYQLNFSSGIVRVTSNESSILYVPDNSSFFLSPGNGFYPILFPEWVVWAWTVVLICLLVAGLIGNSLVVAVVARTRDLRSSTNLLLVNLAGADILVLLVPLPTALTELHTRPETWVLGRNMCKAVPFVEWTVSHASVLTILVISLERYYAICRPLRASYTCTRIRALSCIALIWTAAIFISLPIFFLSQYAFVPYKGETILVPSCFTDMSSWWGKGYYTAMVGLLFFLPLTLLMVLYLLIGRRLMRDSTSAGNFQIRKPEPPNMRARKQVVVMIATVTVFFFVCLLPFRVFSLYIIWDEGSGRSIGPTQFYSLLYASRILLYLNSSINPVLYSLTSSKFRDAFIKIVNREPLSTNRGLSRHSTFTTTGNSMSNGRSGSNIFDPFIGSPNGSLRVLNLAKYGRQWSLDTLPTARKNLSQYGRQSSFTTPPICGWNNGKACNGKVCSSLIAGNNQETKGVFVVKEENKKFLTSFKDVEEHSFLGERNLLKIKEELNNSENSDTEVVLPNEEALYPLKDVILPLEDVLVSEQQ